MTSPDLTIRDVLGDFERTLRSQRKAAKTITAYLDAARRFTTYAEANDLPTGLRLVQRRHVEAWIVAELDAHAPSTAAAHFRHLQQFWRWVVDEDERDVSPMAGMTAPSIPERPVPVFSEAELSALLKVTDGAGFERRRDHALVRLFITTGVRLGEMAGMTVDSVARDDQAILVVGKGDRGRWVPFSDKAAVSLDRYLRERRRHPNAHMEWLWIGRQGRLTSSGITQVLRRRAVEAGITDVRPHRFRHSFAHTALAAGMAEGDLQELAGWRSPQMLRRYGASARSERARANYRRFDLDGNL